ncbi:MAG: M1 family metallopeptidase [Bacteroidetes bacterium]|nr:M1 family metallopeptidase [Bacteroidota bacterium]
MTFRRPLLLVTLAFAPAAFAQRAAQTVPPATHVEQFDGLNLPTPSLHRTADGRPGPSYWQNRADYRIAARLDPATHRVSGSVTLRYTNRSPLDLDAVWLQMEQNIYTPGSLGNQLQPPGTRWTGAFEGGGYRVEKVEVTTSGQRSTPAYAVNDTRMRIPLTTPLAKNGGTVDITVDYSFTVPEYGSDRMGRFTSANGIVYELAQWYPRVYVYDDVHGWNTIPYYGQGEFYLDYGNYDVEITVPSDYVVAGSGALQNARDVLSAQEYARWQQAQRSDETVTIVSRDELGRRPSAGTKTWRFRIENSRDFAWAASKAFVWDGAKASAAAGGTFAQSFYPVESIGSAGATTEGWERSTQMLRHTLDFYSRMLAPYPYPAASNVAGVVGGMEYPGIVFCGARARGQGLFGVTDHEFGHNWFPMMVGSDERRYPWMDEGFNTYINRYSNIAYYGQQASRAGRTAGDAMAQASNSPLWSQPLMTYADHMRGNALGLLGYSKPGAGLVLLREYIVGPERFDAAFREYVQRWSYRHPQPADFFRTIENETGEDLTYFWRGWFFEALKFDQSVSDVTVGDDQTTFVVNNKEGLVLPTVVEVTRADGTTERVRLPAAAWASSDARTMAVQGRIVGLRLDPEGWTPDTDRANNVWGQPAQPAASVSVPPVSASPIRPPAGITDRTPSMVPNAPRVNGR